MSCSPQSKTLNLKIEKIKKSDQLSKIKDEGSELSQKIFDMVFKDLDYSLRELGAGDVSVANNMKKLIVKVLNKMKSNQLMNQILFQNYLPHLVSLLSFHQKHQ